MSDQRFLNHRDASPKTKSIRVLSVAPSSRKPAEDQRGADPYNTSGSFDRKKNWARVGKR